jgi:hypothetical protein
MQLERALLLAAGLILILAVPAVGPRTGVSIYALLMIGMLVIGFGLYYWEQLLFDVAWPAAARTLLFGVVLTWHAHRGGPTAPCVAPGAGCGARSGGRAAGELEAAQRIQMGMLPPPSAKFYGDPRFTLQALIEPAKSVGGDLYDFFKLDGDRMFFMVGDVAGKGLPASIFMAVSKALYKSAALRMEKGADIGEVMRAANAEIARDNPEMLFVTVFAAILDLKSGELDWCNAGHDSPFCLRPGEKIPTRLEGDAGPPLCVIEGYAYRAERYVCCPVKRCACSPMA